MAAAAGCQTSIPRVPAIGGDLRLDKPLFLKAESR
jgi:hypothetical protein